MPVLKTLQSFFAAASRSARRSGHPRKALAVEAAPSVMESPSVTMVPTDGSALTSTPVTKAVTRVSLASGNATAAVLSPGAWVT